MAFEFVLPDIGEGIVEAEVQKWFVKPGDVVAEDQPLVEVMTDKATVTIPSPRRGRVLRLLCAEGQMAKVHAPLLEIAAEDLEAPAPTLSKTPPLRGEAPRALATPSVRALARELGLDLQVVVGTGPQGRVTKSDVEAARGAASTTYGEYDSAPAHLPPPGAAAREAPEEIVPFRGIRKRIAERMIQSQHTAAHFTFVEQVDVTELVKTKEHVARTAQERGVKITYLPFIVKAAVAALRKHPWLNATLDEASGEIHLMRAYHIGIATATPQGLLVPVIRHADRLSLLELAREIDRLSSDAKAGRSRPEDLGGSTFTVTSLGVQGGLFATPIINFPEVAILGIHRIRPTPVVRDGQIVVRDVLHISLSFDHRLIDGHVGASFAYTLIDYLEDPTSLFLELI